MSRIRPQTLFRITSLGLILVIVTALSLGFGSFAPRTAEAQNVDWLSAESASYLNSSGIVVYVPSWLPAGVSGVTPEIYAGDGSYSIYFYVNSGFLYITGTAGAGFPGGSEANLNVQLFENSSVLGYPAINDIGIPEGRDTPIYDKTMWRANGVLYTVSLLGVGTDSVSLANSSLALTAPAPAPTEALVWQPEPTAVPPAPAPAETTQPVSTTVPVPATTQNAPAGNTSQPATNTATQPTVTGPTSGGEDLVTPTAAPSDDGTGGAWYVGFQVDAVSDGTDGPPPPILDDGTGGAG